ncbi:MAG: hypothetical protein COV47_03680 [Candidatus Diapherotrites archaeon CG11_big_fil_rev_8_21_14_0_20_37_9]|nr:MAG: hypothetical protein COV47_03680 [Candidatus Diapherotrites archaeon CG11_big_fil_rev_8_21_14_0_20_37_9]
MEIEVIRNEKDFAEFRFKDQKYTYPSLLKEKLLEDKSVEYVSYILDHPADKGARFVLRVKSGSPKKALEAAAKKVEAEIDDIDKKIQKALK